MGFNTTVVILNDALHQIAEDKEFGKNLADAILTMNGYGNSEPKDVSAGNHGNAATVIETHHADFMVIVEVGRNFARVLSDDDIRERAKKLGMRKR